MPTGPGDDILDAIEAGASDSDLTSKYKLSPEEIKAFKSLHYGLSNRKMAYDEIGNYYPDLNKYFKIGPYISEGNKVQKQPAIDRPDFTKPVKEKAVAESAAPTASAMVSKQMADAKTTGTLQDKFDKKIVESNKRLSEEIRGNDDVVESMIRTQRYKQAEQQGYNEFATGPRSDMPATAMLAGVRNRVLEPETKPQDLPVAPEELQQLKSQIETNEPQARQFVNQIVVRKPEKAKELQSSLYMLDAAQRMKDNPEIGLKVNDNLNKIESGERKYNAQTQQVIEELGFWKGLVEGVKGRTSQLEMYKMLQLPKDQVITIMEDRRAKYDPDQPVLLPKGAGEIGQMAGMEWAALLKGAAVNTIGALTAGVTGGLSETVAPYAAAAVSAPEYYKRGYSSAFDEVYNQLRGEGKSPGEAYDIAIQQANTEGKLSAVEGAVSSVVGGRIGLKELPKFNITGGFKNAVKNVITKTGHFAGETGVEGLTDGVIAAYLQDKKNEAARERGIFRTDDHELRENLEGEMTFAFAAGAITQVGKRLIDPGTYKKILYWMGRQPQETVDAKLGDMVMNGEMSDEDAKDIQEQLAEQRKVDKTIPDDIKDVSRMAMLEKIKERDELEEKKKTVDKALQPEIQGKIDELNFAIAEHAKHLKETDEDKTETKPETQAEVEGATTLPGEEPAKITTPADEGAADKTGKGEAAPAGELHYTNPEGTKYILRDDRLYQVDKQGKEIAFSDKAMQTKNSKELVATIKQANQQADIGAMIEALPSEQFQDLRNNLPGNKNINTSTELINAYNNGDANVIAAVNKTLNKQPVQNAIQEQSPTGVPVHALSGDSQVLGAGDESQGVITEKTGGIQKPTPKQQAVYESSIGMAPNQQIGRIMPAPIPGAQSSSKKKWQIISDLTKGLKQRLIYAKGGPGVAGAYYPGFKGIKITNTNDLDTTAHEIGHAIDDHFDLYTKMATDPDILQELDQFSSYGSTPPANHPNPRRYIDKEGFAEWMRAYIVNPDEAAAMAPKTTALYKQATSEEFQKVIKKFSDDYRVWRFSEGRDQTLSNVRTEYEDQRSTIAKLFKKEETDSDFTINWVNRLVANYINPLNAFEKAFNYAKGIRGIDHVLPANNPIILSRILNGIDGKFGAILQYGMISSKNKVLKDANGKPKNLQWLLEPFDNTDAASIKKDMDDTIAFMIDERTVELSKKLRRKDELTGLGDYALTDVEVAKKGLAEFHNGDPKRLARIQEGAARYREFADDILRYAVDKGRMSEDTYNEIKANNDQYVALQRFLETEPGQEVIAYPRSGGKELGAKGEITHKIRGSARGIESPYANLLDILYKTIRESDRNETMRAFRDMLVDPRYSNMGKPKRLADIGIIGEKGDKETIPIFVDGKPEYWIFQKDIYRQLKAFDLDPFRVWTILRMPGQILRWSTIHFPSFAARNWIRDLEARLILSNTGSGVKHLIGNKEDWQAIAHAGGLNSGYYLKSKAHYYGLMTEAMGEMAKNKNVIVADPVRLKHLWHKYEDLLYKGETSNRVAEYRAAFKKAKEEGMDDYNATIYAAFKARDLADFAIAGHHMQKINQIIPFTNAAVQGLRSAAMSAKENWKGFAGRMLLYSIIPGIAAWLYNNNTDDKKKDYKELPDYQRDMFWNFWIGPNKWLALPKPFELALPQAGIDRALSYWKADQKDAFEGYGADVRKLLLPLDESNVSGPFQSVVEGLANYDFFRERTTIPPEEDPLDLSLRHTETASRLGKILQKFSGWDARKWDHFIQKQFSYTGNFALKLSDIGVEGGRHEFDLTDTGLFKRSPAYNAKSVQEMVMFAKKWGLTKTPAYKGFNGIVGEYFIADNDQEREDIGKKLIEYSQELLLEWKAAGINKSQIERAESKKEANREKLNRK